MKQRDSALATNAPNANPPSATEERTIMVDDSFIDLYVLDRRTLFSGGESSKKIASLFPPKRERMYINRNWYNPSRPIFHVDHLNLRSEKGISFLPANSNSHSQHFGGKVKLI
jgi:hypothetical protein